jgi:hypothetical protein
MNYETARAWLAEEGAPVEPVDKPDAYDFVERVTIGGVSMLLGGVTGHPAWRLETRCEVQYGDHKIDSTGRSKIKLHLRSVFQARNIDYDIVDTDDGVAVTLTRYIYSECLDRQRFMDELRAMQHAGLMVSGEVDRYVVGLV